ncbi:DUF4084 domain-containing protein [Alkalihalobacillus sp. LMS39]|uniref:putative bifunctional diguanylate cyclase/phosphodiesterase n=1 Tax=Alkalihalobacillus sp. LMS39 TaxID=2924032 RepID=UPI001FB28148|nr:DUF4084 domain-containing protein [Alkalihalobacillus sp. LMS39]UOE94854.1 DUF4084 domain-containing protein [Alkalihalobacillus sp. LMS39]
MMPTQKKTTLSFIFLVSYIILYYIWIIVWKHDETILTIGGNTLSIFAGIIATIWLLQARHRSTPSHRSFWLLLALGTSSFTIAELIWAYYENVLQMNVPFPGYPDLFYMLQALFFLAALVFLIFSKRHNTKLLTFVFDQSIIMIVAITFSWHFIIEPTLSSDGTIDGGVLVSLAYPIIDLALLFAAILLFFGISKDYLNGSVVFFMFLGFLLQSFADLVYLYIIMTSNYSSGNWIDPLFAGSIFLVGYCGIVSCRDENEDKVLTPNRFIESSRIALPYLLVLLLFTFMLVTDKLERGLHALEIGTLLAILLLIIRQIIVIIENRRLIQNLLYKTDELDLSEQRYKSLFEFHPDSAYSVNLQGDFTSANAACSNLLGYKKNELIGLSYSLFMNDIDRERVRAHLVKVMAGLPQRYDIQIHNREGTLYYMRITNIPIVVKNKVVGIFGIGKDITEQQKHEEKIKHLAYHDSLTGVANRMLFEKQVDEAIKEAKQKEERFAIVYLDLDHFKSVNDKLGHDIGDKLLINVSKRLQEVTRKTDTVARQGGDEFTLLVKGITQKQDIIRFAEKIVTTLQQPYRIDGHEIKSLPSIGISMFPFDDTTSEGLMKKADTAMYDVKQNGRGHYKFYDESEMTVSKMRKLEKDLRNALKRDELFLLYQPQVESITGQIVGVEALLRWNHPIMGIVSPVDFIPIAEQTGMIIPIGEWVFIEACKQIKLWTEQGYTLKVAVNLSPVQLQQDSIVERFLTILQEKHVNPNLIEFEITEETAIQNIEQVVPKLQTFKNNGITISIDDFGTGYSALSSLASFPISTLKIAREFTNQLERGNSNQTIVTSIIMLAKNLELAVIAEGVENESQAELLKDMQCDEMQGFLFGKPVTAKEIENQLKERPDMSS